MINVSPAITRLAKPATHTTHASGSYDNAGNFVDGDPHTTTISAVIMQISAAELKDLEEGIREEASSICWTTSAIATDDTVEQDGITYRVMKTNDRKLGNYHRAILGRTA